MADGADFMATGIEPWLAVGLADLGDLAGALASFTYRACLWDPPARPVFRFLGNGVVFSEAIAPAPLEAAAVWTGRIPSGTTDLHVSPTNIPGRFGFRLETVRRRLWSTLLVEGHGRAPRPARSALLTRLIGWRPEADNNLAWAIGAHPLDTFRSWAQTRARTPELDGLDRPRFDWHEASPIRVVVAAGGARADAVERTLDSLRQQLFPRWGALVVDAVEPRPAIDPRVTYVRSTAEAAALVVYDRHWFGAIRAGSTLRRAALAVVAEQRARDPSMAMVYGDEVIDGRPALKPGWSPRLAAALPYLGRAVFADPALYTLNEIETLLRGEAWHVPPGVSARPLRRILLARQGSNPTLPPLAGSALPHPAARAAIVVLTRDQPALLARLVTSIRSKTSPGSFKLVVVDNGEAGGPAAGELAELASTPSAMVLARPGPFNFSALCNEAAACSGEEVLLFLNDDMEVISEDWLDRLVARALEPDVGAVGARLTYPDGRLQHVGVLAGMGGSAGHFGAPAPDDDPGWAGRNNVLHEVSAVTGACLAVERRKFETVGGFDSVHLPVELSDIDLCFKLNERGWQTVVDPAVHLMHEESFSRGGATFRRLRKYGDQRAVFLERWRHVLRDDPVFHPALSLYSWRAALG